MRLVKRVYLIDVDNTLLDTEKLKLLLQDDLVKKFKGAIQPSVFWDEYNKIIKKYGHNDISRLSEAISKKYSSIDRAKIVDLFYMVNFKKCLFPNALKIILDLNKNSKLKIYSLGHPIYQSVKIEKSGIEKAVGKTNVIIVQDKLQGIHKIIKEVDSGNVGSIVVIDDRADVLEAAKKSNPKIINIWIRFGKYKDIYPKDKHSVDFEVKSLLEAQNILKTFVCKIDIPETNSHLQIWKGINQKQINQLLVFTKKDKDIKKFTHDSLRFKNRKSFDKWQSGEKVIYTLTENKGDIAGIFWFSKERYKNYKHTFGIRIYPPYRGKHLAKKFIKNVFEDFVPGRVWLKAKIGNYKALNIYRKFGFKKLKEEEDEIYMGFGD